MSEIKNPIAELMYPDSGDFITPDKAWADKENGTNQNFFCPDPNCLDKQNRKLFVKKSALGTFFFSHTSGFDHVISPETLLHKFAIQKFTEFSSYEIPSFTDEKNNYYRVQTVTLDKAKTEVEYSFLTGIRPDVLIVSDKGLSIAIEIHVTHEVKDLKRKKIEAHKLPTIEITLSDFYNDCDEFDKNNVEFITSEIDELFEDIKLKHWIFPPKYEQAKDKLISEKKASSNGGIYLFLAAVMAAILYCIFRKKK